MAASIGSTSSSPLISPIAESPTPAHPAGSTSSKHSRAALPPAAHMQGKARQKSLQEEAEFQSGFFNILRNHLKSLHQSHLSPHSWNEDSTQPDIFKNGIVLSGFDTWMRLKNLPEFKETRSSNTAKKQKKALANDIPKADQDLIQLIKELNKNADIFNRIQEKLQNKYSAPASNLRFNNEKTRQYERIRIPFLKKKMIEIHNLDSTLNECVDKLRIYADVETRKQHEKILESFFINAFNTKFLICTELLDFENNQSQILKKLNNRVISCYPKHGENHKDFIEKERNFSKIKDDIKSQFIEELGYHWLRLLWTNDVLHWKSRTSKFLSTDEGVVLIERYAEHLHSMTLLEYMRLSSHADLQPKEELDVGAFSSEKIRETGEEAKNLNFSTASTNLVENPIPLSVSDQSLDKKFEGLLKSCKINIELSIWFEKCRSSLNCAVNVGMQNDNNATILKKIKREEGKLTKERAVALLGNSKRMHDAANAIGKLLSNIEGNAEILLNDSQKKKPALKKEMDLFRRELKLRQLYFKMASYSARLYAEPYLPEASKVRTERFADTPRPEDTDLDSVAPENDDYDENAGDRLEFEESEESTRASETLLSAIFSTTLEDSATGEVHDDSGETTAMAQKDMPESQNTAVTDEVSDTNPPLPGDDNKSEGKQGISVPVAALSLDDRRKAVGAALTEGRKYFHQAKATFSSYKNSTFQQNSRFQHLENPSTFLDAEQDVSRAIVQATSAEHAFLRARESFGDEKMLTRIPLEGKLVLLTKDEVDAAYLGSQRRVELYKKYQDSPKSRPLCDATLAELFKLGELLVSFPADSQAVRTMEYGESRQRDFVEVIVRYKPITIGDEQEHALKFEKPIIVHVKLRPVRPGDPIIDLKNISSNRVIHAHVKLKDRFEKTGKESYIDIRNDLGAALIRNAARNQAE